MTDAAIRDRPRRRQQVLKTALQLCSGMKEAQGACIRLHSRLARLEDALKMVDDSGGLPSAQSLAEYSTVVAKFLQFLEKYRRQSLLRRVVQNSSMRNELHGLNEFIDKVFGLFKLEEHRSDWKEGWGEDLCVQEQELLSAVEDEEAVSRDFQDPQTRVEALLTLKFEMRRRQNEGKQQLMETMRQTIESVFGTRTGNLPPWFLPQNEVIFQQKEFARGPISTVHHGVWGSVPKVVVKRFIVDSMDISERARIKLEKELSCRYQMNHPNIVKVFGASHVSSPPFVVMEDATNGDLGAFLTRSSENKQQMWRLLYQAALGLDYIHKLGVVHGCLKLNNILLGVDGQAKLSDFGLSAIRGCLNLSNAYPNRMSGNLRWCAPECLTTQPTFASDVYAFGMCMIEAVIGEPPFAFLADDDVRDMLKNGTIAEQPGEMTDDVRKLVVSLTNCDPNKRLGMQDVIKQLKDLAANKETDMPLIVAITCSACKSAESDESRFCSQCGTRMYTYGDQNRTDIIPQTPSSMLTIDTPVPTLVTTILNGSAYEQERALLFLFQVCMDDNKRIAMCVANAIPVLVNVVKSTGAYFNQVCALGCLNWATHEQSGDFGLNEYEALRDYVHDPTPHERESLVHSLGDTRDDQETLKAVVYCACLSDLPSRERLVDAGVTTPLVGLLKRGNETLKSWAAYALGNFDDNLGAVRDAISRKGIIPSIVRKLRSGNNLQQRRAAYTLGCLAKNILINLDPSCAKAISPLMKLLRKGNAEQIGLAAFAMSRLTDGHTHQEEITNRGFITIVAEFLRTGTDTLKENAAYAIGTLADKEDYRKKIIDGKIIAPLVALVRSGTGPQKQNAAYALCRLSVTDALARAITNEGAIFPLIDLLRTGTEKQREYGMYGVLYLAEIEENVSIIRKSDVITSVIKTLQTATKDELKEKVVMVLRSLVDNDEANCVNAVGGGAIAVLLKLMRTGTNDVRALATEILGCLACTDANRVEIAESGGVIYCLKDFLESGTDWQKTNALAALSNLVENSEVKQLVEVDGIDYCLTVLLQHGSNEHKEAAAKVLEKLSGKVSNRGAKRKRATNS